MSALWTLTFLSILVLTLFGTIRQRIFLFQRLETRARVQLAVEAGAKKAVAVLLDDLENNQFMLSAPGKVRRMNNPGEFASIPVADHRVEVVHEIPDDASGAVLERWGMADEQSKINLNTASAETIRVLIMDVLGWGGVEAKGLADAITDWRDVGRHEAGGFFSDEYYESLEFPYTMKDQPFERPDELLLVKGVDRKIYNALAPFVTVYGDGRVNVNTAPGKVLLALGLDAGVAAKILKARRGEDNLEGTADDHIFVRTFDVAADTAKAVPLELREVREIDGVNAQGLLTTESGIYSFTARVLAPNGGQQREVVCVVDALGSRTVYWFEK